MAQHDPCPQTPSQSAIFSLDRRTVFLPFTAGFDAVFDRLFGEEESKAVGESMT